MEVDQILMSHSRWKVISFDIEGTPHTHEFVAPIFSPEHGLKEIAYYFENVYTAFTARSIQWVADIEVEL